MKESFFVHFFFFIATKKEKVDGKRKTRLIKWFELSGDSPETPFSSPEWVLFYQYW